jgi:hypothetical protein
VPGSCDQGQGPVETGNKSDLEALEDTLVRVSYLAMHVEGHLAESDINPPMVLPAGRGPKAVDALVVLRGT